MKRPRAGERSPSASPWKRTRADQLSELGTGVISADELWGELSDVKEVAPGSWTAVWQSRVPCVVRSHPRDAGVEAALRAHIRATQACPGSAPKVLAVAVDGDEEPRVLSVVEQPGRRLSDARTERSVLQLAQTLTCLHSKAGVALGVVRPNGLLIDPPALGSWDAACSEQDCPPRPETLAEHPRLLAPEIALALRDNAPLPTNVEAWQRADLYSFGLALHIAVFGTEVFREAPVFTMVSGTMVPEYPSAQHATDSELDVLASLTPAMGNRNFTANVARVLHACLQSDPDKRWHEWTQLFIMDGALFRESHATLDEWVARTLPAAFMRAVLSDARICSAQTGCREILNILNSRQASMRQGGFGEVFPLSGNRVAKVIRVTLTAARDEPKRAIRERARQRVELHNEITALRRLQQQCSPYVVPLEDALYSPKHNAVALVMPRIAGVDLAQWLQKHGRVTNAGEIADQLAQGLRCMHAAGVAHRDIKPHNIMMVSERPVWIDLGSSCAEALCLRWANDTPRYRAPEIHLAIRTNDPKTRERFIGADVWSFGLVLQELLLGKRTQPKLDGLGISQLSDYLRQPIDVAWRSVASVAANLVPPVEDWCQALVAICTTPNPDERMRHWNQAWDGDRLDREHLARLAATLVERVGSGFPVPQDDDTRLTQSSSIPPTILGPSSPTQ